MDIVTVVVVLVVGAAVAFAVALARRSKAQLAEGVEVLPGMPTGAPPEWAGQHTPEAKTHRRLVSLARMLAVMPLGDAGAIERKVGVERRVQEIDQRLIKLAVAPEAARREAVAAMEAEVDAVEAAVGALAAEPPLA